MEIPPDVLTRILSRHGQLANLLGRYRDLSLQLTALSAVGDSVQKITVHPQSGVQFSMHLRAGVLRRQIELDMHTVGRLITESASMPFDWSPDLVAVATTPIPPPSSEGADDHV